MGLPNSIIKLLEERKEVGLAVGYSPWSDLNGVLWGYIKTIRKDSIEFDLVHVDGSFDETKSYPFSRIYQFDFDVQYATRLKRLGEKEWKKGRSRLVRRASDRDAVLNRALESGDPIECGYGSEQDYFFDAKVISIDGDWIILQRMEDDCTMREEFEATRRSKIKLKVGPFDEAMAWLVREKGT